MGIALSPSVQRRTGLVLSLRWLIALLLFVAIFAGFQGGRYYLANRLQELGIFAALALFCLGAWRSFFLLSYREWRRWALWPIALVLGVMGVSALVFSLNYAGSMLYSFFSAREFLLAFLGPGVYLLCRCGHPLGDVHRVIWFALLALMINYLFFYLTLDLRAAFFSSDHTISNLVTYDEWRGFRLKPPLFAIMVALVAAVALLFQRRGLQSRLFALVVLAVGGYIWSIVLFRSTLATLVLAVLIYPVFLAHRNRLPLMVVSLPVMILLLPALAFLSFEYFLNADGGGIRAKAFALVLDHAPRHLLLGAGEDSAYGQSYQDIVAPYFYPSDLGLAGTAYKYGLVGLGLYLFMHAKIWVSLWRANMLERVVRRRVDPLIWGMLIFMTAQTFNLMLNPGLAYAQGITLGSLSLALASLALAGGEKPKADCIAI